MNSVLILVASGRTGSYVLSLSDALLPTKIGLTISRRDLADFFVEAICQAEQHSKKVILWT